MSEAKPAPGPWTQGTSRNGKECVWLNGATEPRIGMGEDCQWIDCETEANARLIADAGNTYNTTGLTPSQLVERVKDLEEALQMGLEIGDQCSRGFLGAFQKKARAALSKARPNTAEGE